MQFLLQSLMGVFFYTNSVALVEDVPMEEEYSNEHDTITDLEAGYQQVNLEKSFDSFYWTY